MSANDDTILARLKTQNVRGFVSDFAAATKSVLGFATANEEAATATKLSWIEQRAMQQALYTTRRYGFWATTALGGLIAASAKAGITFDETKQQGIDAFSATLGSVTAARHEMNLLVADTHKTGVQLGDITSAAETMQGFGFTIRDVNTDVNVLANYAQRAHKNFGSLVEIFDRIKSTGRFTSLDLRALTSEGIPAIQIFRKELGLTAAQIDALQHGKLIIPSQYALPALTRGLNSRADILGTNVGQQIGKTRSYISQIFGTGESNSGIFGFFTKGLERVNSALARAVKGQQTGGVRGMLGAIDPSGTTLRLYSTLAGVVHSVGDAFGFAWKLAYPFRVLLIILGAATYGLATHTGLLSIGLKVLAFWWVTSRSLMLAYAIGTKVVAAAMFLFRVGQVAATVATLLFTDATFTATDALAAFNLTLLANPITWVVIGLAALAVGMYLLVTRAHQVGQAFTEAFDTVKRAVGDAFNWIVKLWNRLSFHIPGFSVFGHHIGGFTVHVSPIPGIPMLAAGGNVFPGGYAISGDAGPELLRNIGGVTRVTPLARGGTAAGSAGFLEQLADRIAQALNGSKVVMDGATVGELIFAAKQRKEQFA